MTYTLTIFFGDCIETRSVTVEVKEIPTVYIANMFSPNGDGNNDYFVIQNNPEFDLIMDSFRIFDRWGNLVYENANFKTNDENEAWDGRYDEKPLLPGVYVYVLSYQYNSQENIHSGTITLMR